MSEMSSSHCFYIWMSKNELDSIVYALEKVAETSGSTGKEYFYDIASGIEEAIRKEQELIDAKESSK